MENLSSNCVLMAIKTWREILGPQNVDTSRISCVAFGRRTFGVDADVFAVLRLQNTDQVAAAFQIASQFRVMVHTVSRGANWGMGSRAPLQNGSVIFDLSSMISISNFDPLSGVLRVEPGVTFQNLADFLIDQESRYFIPEIGGSPEASVLANSLDRGDAILCDRWQSVGDFQVALPDGRIINTGFSDLGAYRLSGLHSSATGPLVEGLFSQSNFGIVVGAYVRLEILPKNIAIFSSYIGGLQALPPVLDVLREFHISHAIPARSISIWNGVKFLARNSIRSSYSDEVIREAEAESWFLTGFLAAETEHILSERKDHVCAGLKTVTDNVSGQIIRIDNGWKEGFDRFLGKPSPINLRTAYWSCDKVPEYCLMDPDRDNCGLLWLCLAFPFDGNVVTEFVQRAVDLMRPYRIDFNIGMEAASHRCLLAYINLSYARVGEASDAEALACYQDILSLSTEMGLAPYRLANGLAKKATQTETELDRYLSALKRVGDPHSIFSRGRNGIN